jgi:ABC-2 type transport system ATP-binding protein
VSDEQFKKTLDALVELLDIKDILDVQVRKLSLGQRMKCELVAALLHSPKVLFLDEPTIGLDVVSQNNIREFLKKYNKEKKITIILTSHYMEDVEALCERVVVINHGEIAYDGNFEKLINTYIDHKILEVTFKKEVDDQKLEKFGKIKERAIKRVVLEVSKEKVKEVAVKIMTELPVDDILINEVPVEEIVRKIFQEKSN